MEDAGDVTADIANADEPTPDEPATEPSVPTASLVRWYLIIAAVFLVLSALDGAFAALQLVLPDLASGVAAISYGRLLPMATDAFLFGWLTIGLLGAALYIVPKVAGETLRRKAAAGASLILVTSGVAAGTLSIGFAGATTGRRLLEMPLWAAAVIFVGFGLAAWSVTATAGAARERLGPPTWYFVAATWWLTLSWLAGNLPGIDGFNGAIQTSFFRASVSGLWFVAAGTGVVYYLVPKLVGTDPRAPSSLTALGFWSLALVWAGTAARDFVYGAAPDWYETLGVAFSISLLIPVLIIFADFVLAIRGRFAQIADRVVLRFVLAGAFLFLVVPLADLLLAVRTSSAVVRMTEWVAAYDYLLFFGALSMWLFAFAYHAAAGGRPVARRGAAMWHLRLSLIGLIVAIAGMAVAGLYAGFTWAAGANADVATATGDGFASTAIPLEPYYWMRAVGTAVFALAQILFVVAFIGGAAKEQQTDETGVPEPLDLQFGAQPGTVSWNRLRYGAVLVFAGLALFVWLLPSLDPSTTSGTLLGDNIRAYPEGSPEAAGREVYVREGCWYCHTQEVRGIVTDVGLGPVSIAGDYVHESPILLGVERIGPDLMHVGSREDTDSYRFVSAHLSDPRADREWSTMPSYSYLSDADLDAVTQYIIGLE